MKSNASKSTAFSVWWYRWSGKNAFMRLTGFFFRKGWAREETTHCGNRLRSKVNGKREKSMMNTVIYGHAEISELFLLCANHDEYRTKWKRRTKRCPSIGFSLRNQTLALVCVVTIILWHISYASKQRLR